MSNFVYFLTRGGGEKRLKLGDSLTEVDIITNEWCGLRENIKPNDTRYHQMLFQKISHYLPTHPHIDTIDEASCAIQIFLNEDTSADFVKKNIEIIELCLEKLFFVWRDLIERAVVKILQEHDMELPDFESSDTSSPIIYYLMYDRGNYPDHRAVFQNITYDYKGYCTHAKARRLGLLLDFPIGKLFSMSPTLDIPLIYEQIYEKILPLVGLPEGPPPKAPEQSPRNTTGNLLQDIELICEKYNELRPHLKEVEDYYNGIARNIDKASYIIQHEILTTFL